MSFRNAIIPIGNNRAIVFSFAHEIGLFYR